MNTQRKHLKILGIRGLPAKHGGFETFAAHLAPYLVSRGWRVTVYCQEHGIGKPYEDQWRGVNLVRIPVRRSDSSGSVAFDWLSTKHAALDDGIILTLGYNTAIFCFLYRLRRRVNVINMDGIEWKREKWTRAIRGWFWINERLGCWLGNHLIADHPSIKDHLATRVNRNKITVIPYGSDQVKEADPAILDQYGLTSRQYCLVVARPEPENSIREIVTAYSSKRRGMPLVLLGDYSPDAGAYPERVKRIASEEVRFLGAIYDEDIVQALRHHCRLYIHGHRVGGTNPSLVEALGAGSPVLAQDNRFNRWVAGKGARYFVDDAQCSSQLDNLLGDLATLDNMRTCSREQHAECFTWERVLGAYNELLAALAPRERISVATSEHRRA